MPTIAEDVGGEDKANRTGVSVESADKGGAGGMQIKDVSGSTDISPTKTGLATNSGGPNPNNNGTNNQDELVQMLQKGVGGGGGPQKNGFGANQFVHPYSRVRSREEIEAEVLAELREIDKMYNII